MKKCLILLGLLHLANREPSRSLPPHEGRSCSQGCLVVAVSSCFAGLYRCAGRFLGQVSAGAGQGEVRPQLAALEVAEYRQSSPTLRRPVVGA